MDSPFPHLIDVYERRLSYLRISVTDRCNLNCIYCATSKDVPKLNHADILTYEEILRIARVAVSMGVKRIRVTGGEPLVRKGVCGFIERLAGMQGLEEVTLTTNGLALRPHLEKIWAAGVRRLNISLDTLRPERFKRLTGCDAFEQVWNSIETAEALGFHPLKINMVVMAGINEDELLDFGRLSMSRPYHVRFIEYMPIGTQASELGLKHIPGERIMAELARLGALKPLDNAWRNGPAECFRIQGAAGQIGFISPITRHFCGRCNRLRLTASGALRPCLLAEKQVDLRGPLRSGAGDRELARLLMAAARAKPHGHDLDEKNARPVAAQMSSIGG